MRLPNAIHFSVSSEVNLTARFEIQLNGDNELFWCSIIAICLDRGPSPRGHFLDSQLL